MAPALLRRSPTKERPIMSDRRRRNFLTDQSEPFAIVLGTNEIASAIGARLIWEGFQVVLSHDPFPPVIRRGMAFHDALFDDEATVDGIIGQHASSVLEIIATLSWPGRIAVTSLHLMDLFALRAPDVIIDARMQKHRVTPDLRGLARLAVGVGPNFIIDRNCDIAIETHPASAGKLVDIGRTKAADGLARDLGGVGKERFIYAQRKGVWRTPLDIGAQIFKGYVLGHLDGLPVRAPMDGFLRGVARDGTLMPANVKLVEIDPRGRNANWFGTDERGRAIATATAEAVRARMAPRKRAATREATFH